MQPAQRRKGKEHCRSAAGADDPRDVRAQLLQGSEPDVLVNNSHDSKDSVYTYGTHHCEADQRCHPGACHGVPAAEKDDQA